MKCHWKNEPDDHDYPAAADYLSLVMPKADTAKRVRELRSRPIEHRKAKDLLRASRLTALPRENVHVAKDLKKVRDGKLLSPVLLVRGHDDSDTPLVIADGYHRICASYLVDENEDIPCRIAG
jgi:hypothetical protein